MIMIKDKQEIQPECVSNLSRRFVEIEAENKKCLAAPAIVKPKLNEAEAQKIHRDLHTFGSGAFEIDGDKINQVPQDEVVLKKRGRPAKPDKKSNAERVAAFRAKKRAEKRAVCNGNYFM